MGLGLYMMNLISNARGNHVRSDIGFFTHDQISIAFRRLKELVIHRTDRVVVLPNDPIQIAATLTNVTVEASNESNIGFDVEVNL